MTVLSHSQGRVIHCARYDSIEIAKEHIKQKSSDKKIVWIKSRDEIHPEEHAMIGINAISTTDVFIAQIWTI